MQLHVEKGYERERDEIFSFGLIIEKWKTLPTRRPMGRTPFQRVKKKEEVERVKRKVKTRIGFEVN